MYLIKIALIVFSVILLPASGFSKPNPQLKEQKIKSQLEFVQHLIDKGEAKDALSLLEGLHQDYPEDSTVLESLSHFYFKHADYPSAALYFDKLYAVDPSNTPALLLAAQSYAHTANYSAAIHNYKLYLQHHPEDATIWKNLGLLYSHSDAIQDATKAYLKAFNAKHSSLTGEDYLKVGQWFLELENRKRAREFLSHALKDKEVREKALLQLIDLDIKEQKFSNAKQKLSMLKGLNKDALTLYPLDTIQTLIEDAEALANQPPTVSDPGDIQEATTNPTAAHPEQTSQHNRQNSAEEPVATTDTCAVLPSTLTSSFDSNFKFDLPPPKHRALLEPLPMQTASLETQEENALPLSTDHPEVEEASLTTSGLSESDCSVLSSPAEANVIPVSTVLSEEETAIAVHPNLPEDVQALSSAPTQDDIDGVHTAAQSAQAPEESSPLTNNPISPSEALADDSSACDKDLPKQSAPAVPEETVLLAATTAPQITHIQELSSVEEYLHAGKTLELAEAYDQAVELYTKALKAYPKTAELFYRLSSVYFKSGHLAEAEAQAFEAMKHEPHSLNYTFHYLKIAQRTWPADSFILQLKKAKSRFPEVPELSLALARSYEYQLQNMNQAIAFYKEFLDHAPLEHSKRDEAEEALRRLL